jgi:hypothetical protein
MLYNYCKTVCGGYGGLKKPLRHSIFGVGRVFLTGVGGKWKRARVGSKTDCHSGYLEHVDFKS